MYHMLRCTNMYYHIIARTSVYFTLLHTLYIFSDCNALNIQFWTCNRDVNNSSNLSDILILGIIVFRRLDLSGPSICSTVIPDLWIHSCVLSNFHCFLVCYTFRAFLLFCPQRDWFLPSCQQAKLIEHSPVHSPFLPIHKAWRIL